MKGSENIFSYCIFVKSKYCAYKIDPKKNCKIKCVSFLLFLGEEICENYGLMYTMKSYESRQKVLNEHYK